MRLRLGWGIGALASLVIVAKMGDTGAYFVGRAIGRHKMSPVLSPKKTIEGAVGALVFSLAASWATFRWLVPATAVEPAGEAGLGPNWIVYGVAVCVAGIVGDLAESLIKRDTGVKDSGANIPGLAGSWTCWIPCSWPPPWPMRAGPSQRDSCKHLVGWAWPTIKTLLSATGGRCPPYTVYPCAPQDFRLPPIRRRQTNAIMGQ